MRTLYDASSTIYPPTPLTDTDLAMNPLATRTTPLALSDAQLDTIHRLSWPLARADRGAFLQAVADELAKHPELLGDGHIARVGIEMQRRFWSPPDVTVIGGPAHIGKYSR